ncbi:MAG: hypothetical protein ACRDOH_36395, partial [Streptosporangiaceae bacterium]
PSARRDAARGIGLFSAVLEPTMPPQWSQQPPENWRRERGTAVRLQLECRRDGWDPWTLTGEVSTAIAAAGGPPGGIAEIP